MEPTFKLHVIRRCDFLPMSGQYNLDDDASTSDDNPPICINLLPLVVKRLRPSTTDRSVTTYEEEFTCGFRAAAKLTDFTKCTNLWFLGDD